PAGCSGYSDALDFDLPRRIAQTTDDQGARRTVLAQNRRAPGADRGDIGWVWHDCGDLHEVRDLHARGPQLRLQVSPGQRALRFGVTGDAAVDGDANLATDVERAGRSAHFDGLRILAGRCWRITRVDVAALHGCPHCCVLTASPE